jgi:transcriptional regulator with XRE-family HTH domain
MTINQRFVRFLNAEKINQKTFSDITGLSDKNVSNVATGHVLYPKADFFIGIAKFFPTVNLTWLLTGKGEMYLPESSPPSDVVQEPNPPPYTQGDKKETLLDTIQALSNTVAALEQRINVMEAEIRKLKRR